MKPASSVFVGGGTPSLLSVRQMGEILSDLPQVVDAEVTVECNPDDVTVDKLHGFRKAGVTRISLGVQSMVPEVLSALGRVHDIDNVKAAVDAIDRVGFKSFNLDLIYGTMSESHEDWATTLSETLALGPQHVSAYALTVEAGTPLADDKTRAPDDDDQADKYLLADDMLSAAGLVNYEISNWARSGHECRHNLLYWTQGDYRGFGCAAHSHHQGRRWWNVRTPERYIAMVENKESPEAGAEELDDTERAIEGLQLALRTRDGVPDWALPTTAIAPDGPLGGLVAARGNRLVLTRSGRLLANEVAMSLKLE